MSAELVQGDTWRLQVGWYNPRAGTRDPDLTSPVDITGYTAQLWVVHRIGDTAAPMLELSSPANGLTVNGPMGTVDVRASPAQTSTLDVGTWLWELEIDNGTDRYTLVRDQLLVRAQVVT